VQQSDLAAEVSVSAGYLANLESGERQAVRPEVFSALCVALRVEDRRALMQVVLVGRRGAEDAEAVEARRRRSSITTTSPHSCCYAAHMFEVC
jgi:transcriptional regulator with XRE-family HTH domain